MLNTIQLYTSMQRAAEHILHSSHTHGVMSVPCVRAGSTCTAARHEWNGDCCPVWTVTQSVGLGVRLGKLFYGARPLTWYGFWRTP